MRNFEDAIFVQDDTEWIDITGCDLRAFVREAYALSRAQGLGHLHYTEGTLTDSEVDEILSFRCGSVVLSLDYIRGRSVKRVVWERDGKRKMARRWLDHSDKAVRELFNAAMKSATRTK